MAAVNAAEELTQGAAPGAEPAAPVVQESAESQAASALVARVTAGDKAVAEEVAALVKAKGVAAITEGGLLEKLAAALNNAASPVARETAAAVVGAIAGAGVTAEAHVVPFLARLLELHADKATPVRAAAADASQALVAALNPYATKTLLPTIFAALEAKTNWQTKKGALALMSQLTGIAPTQVSQCLPQIVPEIVSCLSDAREQVKVQALAALTSVCAVMGNRDVEPFVPALVSCMARPSEVSECVHKLAATTFVQSVEAPTLSIMVPLLVRGLRERETAVKRKSAVIIDNMAKLVDNPLDAAVFLPRLLPELAKVKEEVSNPECRKVAGKAYVTLQEVGAEGKVVEFEKADPQAVLATLKESMAAVTPATVDPATLAYAAALAATLCDLKRFNAEDWEAAVTPYLATVIPSADAQKITTAFLNQLEEESHAKESVDEDVEEGEDLCNCEFSLAYGGKILLNNARLRLKRGKRYGLCGPNGAGKSTLMRAIANGQLEGFPPKDQLRTVYVEHDIDASESMVAVVDFVFMDKVLQGISAPSRDSVVEVLSSVGFTDAMQQMPVSSLSGGWKMKLALARAMLMKADIMLLDEPTNHLDVKNVAWLEHYLTHLPDVTSMVVSHDSGFLDNVCTAIVHYEGRKLRTYKGNLSEFVKVKPEARSYYELEAATLKFILPEPGFLEGIKSKDRAILKMQRAAFTYPGSEKKALEDITIQCSLNSRVAVTGPNGAGKSTMIKLLTGELEPQEGVVWKHPNLRVAYVAQHAFHHVEQHLEKTPNEYIQWRYAIGEDREGLTKVSRVVSEEEEKKMAAVQVVDGQKKVVEKLLGRRKLKKSYEYEVQWVGLHSENNTWLPRDKLEDMGFGKMVNEIDVTEAARMGLHTRPLTQKVIEKHLEDLGIEPEFGTHSHIRGLSGGQKVKVVIAAAMWNNPHMLVLDEPTNYLDRESLGALASAIKDYGGGVVMITHNREFSSALCPETWAVDAGRLVAKGQSAAVLAAQKLEWKREEEMIDAFGNIVKINAPKKQLSNKEKKNKERMKKLRRKAGEVVSDSEEDY